MQSETGHDARAAMRGKRSGFRTLIGYQIATWREGYGEVRMTLDERHLNSALIGHGGLYMTLLDAAMGHAATWCSLPGNYRPHATLSLSTSFLEPARAGDAVVAVGRLVSSEGRNAVCQGEIRDAGGRLLAAGQASFRYARGGERVEGVPRGAR